ncbi:hypothetical protein FKM82_013180 [Ascaphus truei]
MDVQLSRWTADSASRPWNFSDCPNGSMWIWNVFNECAEDGRDVSSVVLGLFSILCFVAAAFPQYYKSCKTGNMDKAISIWFLLGWMCGDSCNCVGAFLAHQLPLQTYTAVYYVLADLVMLSLYLYYKYRNQERSQFTPINAVCGFVLFGSVAAVSLLREPRPPGLDSTVVLRRRHLLSADEPGSEPFTTREIIGLTIGSFSSVLYLISRLPQIITNFRRRSTEGLSLSLFALVILGNLTYGLGILLKNPDHGQSEVNYVLHHLPWLIGSLGVVSFDLLITFQFFAFRKRSSHLSTPDERDPLLHQPKSATYA